jgi:aerobic C4-dicarboxylate transport protein
MTPSPRPGKLPIYRSLYVQVITAVIIGVALGHFFPHLGESM